MHLSLKGSLIRSPMLNRVGQRLLQLFEGASAAYSLRDLASNIASVVRVRRASDNSEKDFSAADVSSGAMTQWVNGQVVPPLDVRELVDGERTGALIPAAAAYSLRNLSTSYTGDVVDVRRSSDDALEAFSAAQVADGTLTDWVNGNQVHYESNFASNTNNWNLIASSWSGSASWSFNSTDDVRLSVTTAGVSTGARRPAIALPRPSNILVGENYSIEVDYEVISGTPVLLGSNINSNANYNHNETLSGSGTSTISESPFNASTLFLYFDGDNHTFEVSIKAIRFKSTVSDGFVTRWYDQSGNANHATQGTNASQPKIVDAGSLVSGGIDFDGVDDFLSAGTGFASASKTAFCVNNPNVLNSNGLFGFGSSQVDRFFVQYNLNAIRTEINGANASIAATAGQNLTTHLHTDDISVGLNGSPLTTTTTSFGGVSSTAELRIGQRFGVAFTDNFDGSIEELIIYNSDQSDNRTAFEANIGETYGIDLPAGVDTGYDQVDGFVETWYDQSGNGNDAVQSVAGSQPKIVDAGVLVSGGIDFDGVDDFLTSLNLSLTDYTFAGVYTVKTIDDNAGFLGKGIGSNREFFVRMKSDGKVEHRVYSTGSSSTFDTITSSASAISADTAAILAGSFNGTTNAIRLDINGTVLTDTSSVGLYAGTSSLTIPSALGNEANTTVAEFIIYNSDQTDNLTAIETNINNQYDIY